ncbi:hypothetical protein [Solilutibacter silvestris]|uniref:Uncharacterized protein n=1 Tax=Solilutibacter silvestris TaxID=1645665 RepID=A0A2K1PX17_9GAMM|nr:hypothetical protein [Lysobacter silvestris]PNS07340.1 hypothetical protein Lysil_1516 [Lysobacter silvestris]
MTRAQRADHAQLSVALSCKDGHRKVNVNLSPLLIFGWPFAEQLARELGHFSQGRAIPAGTTAYALNRWGMCIADLEIDLSKFDLSDAGSLDELHLIFLEWFFTRNPSVTKARLQTLRLDWNRIGNFIRFCQRRNTLPLWNWFALPTEDANSAREAYVRAHPREFIGQPKLELDHSDFLARVVSARPLAISTDECLKQLSNELKSNLKRIEEACYKNIDAIRNSFAEGNRLAAQADVELLNALTTESPRESFLVYISRDVSTAKGKYVAQFKHHVFSPNHPNGLANLIWWIKNRHGGCLDRVVLEKFDPNMISSMTKHDPFDLRRYLGALRFDDLSWFITAIACRCPEVSNLSTILNIGIDELTWAEDGSLRITSVKNRAGEERSSLVDTRLQAALLLLRDLTASCRHAAKLHPFYANALFLGWRSHQQRGLPHRLIESNVVGKLLRANLSADPELVDLRFTTYSMIRNSHAIIEFIRSNGDWNSVSRTLGNSVSISMRHYVPPEIKNLLRERRVRQHQNEMLYVASVGQDFDPLLSMDLSSREEIESFLANSIKLDATKTNVLLHALAKKIEGCSGTQDTASTAEIHSAIFSLSERSLALLFRYEECLSASSLPQDVYARPSEITGVAPNFWCSLATYIRALFSADHYDNFEHQAILKHSLELLPSLRASIVFDAPW